MKEDNSADRLFRERSPQVVAMDNLIRRKLRVSDPGDPMEIAEALGKLYMPEKERLNQEALGFSTLSPIMTTTIRTAITASDKEVEQAVGDVERDLKNLTSNSLLKDIEPELNGWASAIRAAIADGISAARMALDPRQRDLAFTNRRLLGDYARVVRYVGALTPNLNIYYRRLAQSLDEVSSMMLVLMGEALANIGFGGHFLLQVSLGELQERRDAVLYSLRNLIGSVQENYGSDQWPRGLVAYRQLVARLESSGHNDLRALLQENNLTRLMDDLIHRAAGGSALGMRALGATVQLSIERLQRLMAISRYIADPEPPPLAAFLSAVQLFIDAFTHGASGTRLLHIARPPIVFYGLYGIAGAIAQSPQSRLQELVVYRGQFATASDCYLGCGCDVQQVCCQMVLDKLLYDIDRAIDLYALGTSAGGWGEPEQRAAAFGFVIGQAIESICLMNQVGGSVSEWPCEQSPSSTFETILEAVRTILWWNDAWRTMEGASFVLANGRWSFELPGGSSTEFDAPNHTLAEAVTWIRAVLRPLAEDPDIVIYGHEPLLKMLQFMRQELCMQRKSEMQWRHLLQTMTPSCQQFRNGQLGPVLNIINGALQEITSETDCESYEPSIPPTIETSLDGLVNNISRVGEGRDEE